MPEQRRSAMGGIKCGLAQRCRPSTSTSASSSSSPTSGAASLSKPAASRCFCGRCRLNSAAIPHRIARPSPRARLAERERARRRSPSSSDSHEKSLRRPLLSLGGKQVEELDVYLPPVHLVRLASFCLSCRISSKRLLTSRNIAIMPWIEPDSVSNGCIVNSTESEAPSFRSAGTASTSPSP